MAERPSSAVWNTPGRWKKCCAPQPPTPAEAGKGQDGCQRSSSLKVGEGGPEPGSAAVSPAGSEGPAPRRWGLGGGTDFTPLPLRPLAVQGTPRPLQGSGWGRQPNSPEPCSGAGRGGARMGARPPPPRSTARQRGPPRSRARAGPKGRRPRVAGESADPRSVSPHSFAVHHRPPHLSNPLQASDSALT